MAGAVRISRLVNTPRKDALRLDEIDRKILRASQQGARLTTAQLAEKIGLSTTPAVESSADYERFLRQKLHRTPGIRHSHHLRFVA
jgi:hypothetical protein